MSQLHHSRRDVLKLLGSVPIVAAAGTSVVHGAAGRDAEEGAAVPRLSPSAMGRHRRGDRDGRRGGMPGDRMDGPFRRAHPR